MQWLNFREFVNPQYWGLWVAHGHGMPHVAMVVP